MGCNLEAVKLEKALWPICNVESTYIKDKYLYVAAGTGGLKIFDCSNPASLIYIIDRYCYIPKA